MSEPDELFSLRTAFWLGSYHAGINESVGLNRLKPHLLEEKDEYIYRCYIGLGQYRIVLQEIPDSPTVPIGKRAIKLLATYLENPNNREIIQLQLTEWLNDATASQNKTLQTIAATIFANEDNVKEAFRILRDGANLEQHALLVQLYLRIFRVDLAQKQLKTMKTMDEDSALTMLATAWVHMAPGQAKAQEAVYIYEELIDKYSSSTMLLNGLAVAKMHLGLFEEAEVALQEALTKNGSDADTLANSIVVAHHLHRGVDVIKRYTTQLRMKAPNHGLLTSLAAFEDSFDRTAAKVH